MRSVSAVRTGLEVLEAQQFAPLRGLVAGLVMHPAAVTGDLRSTIQVLADSSKVRLAALFGPEHGLQGQAQDLVGVSGDRDSSSGLQVHSLYGETVESLRPTPEQLRGLDALVIDLQDVGTRYYTFQATMLLRRTRWRSWLPAREATSFSPAATAASPWD